MIEYNEKTIENGLKFKEIQDALKAAEKPFTRFSVLFGKYILRFDEKEKVLEFLFPESKLNKSLEEILIWAKKNLTDAWKAAGFTILSTEYTVAYKQKYGDSFLSYKIKKN